MIYKELVTLLDSVASKDRNEKLSFYYKGKKVEIKCISVSADYKYSIEFVKKKRSIFKKNTNVEDKKTNIKG